MNRLEIITIRIPQSLLLEVEKYAKEKGFLRTTGPNVSGAILSILREKLGVKTQGDYVTFRDLNIKLMELETVLRADFTSFEAEKNWARRARFDIDYPGYVFKVEDSIKTTTQILEEMGEKRGAFYAAKSHPEYPSSQRLFSRLKAVGGKNLEVLQYRFPELKDYL